MNKEQLTALGLDEKQIQEVFRLNGLAVNAAKADLDTTKQELADTKVLLTEANTQIEGFKDLDVEGIKKASADYKKKYEDAQATAAAELEKVKFNHELENAARNFKARNVKAALALLDTEALRESNNRSEDIKAAFEALATENEFLFETKKDAGTDPKPKFTRPGQQGSGTGITQAQFQAMGYKERVELKNKDLDLYNQLKGE